MTISVILLAGGTGSRMQTPIPKQYLLLNQKPLIHYSFDLFYSLPGVSEIVIVCEEQFQKMFMRKEKGPTLRFALPGKRRQDSVYHGLQALTTNSQIVCIHDGVRPFITESLVMRVIQAAQEHGAATAGMPLKYTIKECDDKQIAKQTPDRSKMWEIQTPQVIKKDLLEKGFKQAISKNLTVTDDVSLIELLGLPVKIVEGSYQNLKITTPDDMIFAEMLLKNRSHA